MARIKKDEGLTDSQIAGEAQLFVLTNQEKGQVPKSIDVSFRKWSARLKTLARPPAAAAPGSRGPAAPVSLEQQIENVKGNIALYRKMGRTYEIEHQLEPRLKQLQLQLESQQPRAAVPTTRCSSPLSEKPFDGPRTRLFVPQPYVLCVTALCLETTVDLELKAQTTFCSEAG